MKVFSPLFAVALAAAMIAPKVDATCSAACTDSTSGCVVDQSITAGASFNVPVTGAACSYAKYLSELKYSATGGEVTVTFSDPTLITPAPTPDQTKDGDTTCYSTYANVGKGVAKLTKDVTATFNCAASGDPCKVTFLATYVCQRDPDLCAKDCGDGCTPARIAAGGNVTLKGDLDCPDNFSYLTSLKVGAKDKTAVSVAFTGVSPAPASTAPDSTCYYEYGQSPADLTKLTADVTAAVKCANAAAECTVQYAAQFGCAATACAGTCTDCEEKTLAAAASWVVTKPAGSTCEGGFMYPKIATVKGKYDANNVDVSFNTKLAPTPKNPATCFVQYEDPAGKIPAITEDVKVTVKCKDAAKACTVQTDLTKKANWGCYIPPDATTVYTRSGQTGANCDKDVSSCANRCAKSYKRATLNGDYVFLPQIAGSCADCAVPKATPSQDLKTAAGTDLDVTFDDTANTLKLDYKGAGALCTNTYSKAAFANTFTEKTYTRGSVEPSTCVVATDCAYKCAAEFALTKPAADPVDTITATEATVEGCTCKPRTAIVGDAGNTASVKVATTTYVYTVTGTGVTVAATTGENTCTAVYTEKVAPTSTEPKATEPTSSTPPATSETPATTTKTGTSAGVSALGGGADAGLVTVTLVAAAAGVQAVGLPA